MALPKRHWGNAAQSPGFVPDAACGRSGVREIITTSALAFDVSVFRNTTWYCSDCAKAARLALAKESAPKPDSRTDSDRYAELRALVEAWQKWQREPQYDQADASERLMDWSHR